MDKKTNILDAVEKSKLKQELNEQKQRIDKLESFINSIDSIVYSNRIAPTTDTEKELVISAFIRMNNIIDNIFWEDNNINSIYKKIKSQIVEQINIIRGGKNEHK